MTLYLFAIIPQYFTLISLYILYYYMYRLFPILFFITNVVVGTYVDIDYIK